MATHFELKTYKVFLSDRESAYYVIAYDAGHAIVEVCNTMNSSLKPGEMAMAPDEFKKDSVVEISLEDAYEEVIDFVYLDPKVLGGLNPDQQIAFGELFEYLESDELNAMYPVYGVVGDNFIGYM